MRDPFWKSLKILLNYKRQLSLAGAGALVSAGCFGLGILALEPILDLLLKEQQSIGKVAQKWLGGPDRPKLLQDLASWIEIHAPEKFWGFVAVMGLILVLSVIGSTGRYVHELLTITLVNRAAMVWRKQLFRRLIHAPMIQLLKTGHADHISRLLFDVRVMTRGYMAVMGKAVSQVLKGAAALAAAFWMNWRLAGVSLIVLIPIVILLRHFGTRIRRASRRALRQRGYMVNALNEAFGGIHVVKVHNAEGYERRRFGTVNKALFREEMKMRQAKALASPVVDTLALFGVIAVATIAAWLIFEQGVPAEQIMMVLLALVLAAASGKPLATVYSQLRESSAAASRAMNLLTLPVEPTGTDAPRNDARRKADALPRHQERIQFEAVSFTYPESNRPAVDGVSLEVSFGTTVAVVGSNGAGKSTLMNMLPRLSRPDEGRILIDGRDINDISLRSLRRQIAVVTQQQVLFEGSIADNIAYGRRHEPREKIVAASKAAHAHGFIENMPDEYDSILGEDGVGLSGGQVQRICIARAILRDPAILILDEATSQIDSESEGEINKALRDFCQGRTTFVIAHRLSTVLDADGIVVMDAGRIVDQGLHDELSKRCLIYRTLTQTQMRPPAA